MDRDTLSNRILLAFPEAIRDRVVPELEPVELISGREIYRYNEKIHHIYFVESGLISMVKSMKDGRTVEVGVVAGRKGVSGTNALFGVDRAFLDAVVQIPGHASRIDRAILQRELTGSEAARELLQRYDHFSVCEFVQTAACNRLHTLEERCARWLLIAHDSANADQFPLTHEYLAMMLGVRRSGVTITASLFQRAGLIRYKRGLISILDRHGLEAAACECYAANRTQLDAVFEPPGNPRSNSQ